MVTEGQGKRNGEGLSLLPFLSNNKEFGQLMRKNMLVLFQKAPLRL